MSVTDPVRNQGFGAAWPTDAASMLAPVLARLAVAEGRLRRLLAADAVIVGLASALAVLLVLRLVARLGGAGFFGAELGAHILAGLGLGLGGALIFAGFALGRVPGVLGLARRADRTFTLHERVSTAIEVGRSGQPGDSVTAALLADASGRADTIDPTRLVPVAVTRAAWAIPVLLAGVALVQLLPIEPMARSRASTTPDLGLGQTVALPAPELLTEPERTTIAAALRQIADNVQLPTQQPRTAYQQAVARSIADLADQVEQGALNRQQAADTLNSLVNQAAAAFAGTPNATDGAGQLDVATALAETLRELNTATAFDPADLQFAGAGQLGDTELREPDGTTTNAPPGEARAPVTAPAPGNGPDQTGDTRAVPQGAPTQDTGAPAAAPRTGTFQFTADWAGDPDFDINFFTSGGPPPENPTNPINLGAIAEAGAGGGNEAGFATADLFGPAPPDAPPPGATEDVNLPPGAGAAQGRRFSVDAAPTVEARQVEAFAGEAGAWRATDETAFAHNQITAADRAVVAEYFARPDAPAGE